MLSEVRDLTKGLVAPTPDEIQEVFDDVFRSILECHPAQQ
jgi:hypothetical protein